MIDLGLKQKEVLFENTEKELLSAFYASSTGKSNKEFRFAKVDTIVTGEEKITLGKKVFESFDCFLVHVPSKVDEVVVYEIMSQLTKDNVDFSVLDKISITNLGGEN